MRNSTEHANLKPFGIRNGTRGTVLAIDIGDDGTNPLVRIRLEDGREVAARWAEFAPPRRNRSPRPLPRVTHAYAGTVYSVQGRTAEAAVFHVGSRTDAREIYVAMTRHRAAVRVVVDADRLLREASPEIAEAGADETGKLAALGHEAARFDEKLNVADVRHRVPDRTERPARQLPTRRAGLDLAL